jgi:YihY family inner membrane protein
LKIRRVLAIVIAAIKTFARIDGAQHAAAFAHYAFFSVFPLIILIVAMASVFIDRDRAATQIVSVVQTFVPLGAERQSYIVDTLVGVVKARRQAGVVSSFLLVWAAMGFFATLIRATNRAWGAEVHAWWRLPLKSLVFLAFICSAVPLGIAVPVLIELARNRIVPLIDAGWGMHAFGRFAIPWLMGFLGVTLFYKSAPRRRTRFAEVWTGALCATLLLLAAESLFGIYLRHFATLNAVYGAFGTIIALLLWTYLSGCIVIFGACVCAAQAEGGSSPAKPNRTPR